MVGKNLVLEGKIHSSFFSEKKLEGKGYITTPKGENIKIIGLIPQELTDLNVSLEGNWDTVNKEKIFRVNKINQSKEWFNDLLPGFPPRHVKLLAEHSKEAWDWLIDDGSPIPMGLEVIPEDTVYQMKDKVRSSMGFAHTVTALMDKGLSSKAALSAYRELATESLHKIKSNIYSLAIYPNIPFSELEHIAKEQGGYLAHDPRRLAGAIAHIAYANIRDGNTFMGKELVYDENKPTLLKGGGNTLREGASKLLEKGNGFMGRSIPFVIEYTLSGKPIKRMSKEVFEQALKATTELFKDKNGKPLWVNEQNMFALAPIFWKEIQLAQSLVRLRSEKAKREMKQTDPEKTKKHLDNYFDYLDASQREAVHDACNEPFCLWTGPPGVGKTATLLAYVSVLLSQGIDNIAITATTGQAAMNIQESFYNSHSDTLVQFINNNPPRTTHAVLKLKPNSNSSYYKYTDHPLPYDVIIVDEFSMADTFISGNLFWAAKEGTRILCLGDPDQLASVGSGQVLKDITYGIAKKNLKVEDIPKWCEFKTRHRNNSYIAEMSEAIKEKDDNQRLNEFYEVITKGQNTGEIEVYSFESPQAAQKKALEIIKDANTLILTPRHEGVLGTESMNELVQNKINPTGSTVWGFKLNDPILQLLPDRLNDIRNGEKGIVVDIKSGSKGLPSQVSVTFPSVQGGHHTISHYGSDIGKNWGLGYVATIHKAQGGQADTVICLVEPKVWTRTLLYTAVSRAKSKLILIEINAGLNDVLTNKEKPRRCSLVRRYEKAVIRAKKAN